jgi:phage protein D
MSMTARRPGDDPPLDMIDPDLRAELDRRRRGGDPPLDMIDPDLRRRLENSLSHFHVEVDGKFLSDEDREDILDITVENSLHLPDMLTIRLADPKFTWLDRDVFKIGARVTVYSGYDTGKWERICSGEVTALEMDLNALVTPSVLVRAYDRSHRLQKGRTSRSFTKMKDSDIVKKVAQEMGLPCEAENSGQTHEYVFQNNQTNWEFLQERARRIGYECFVADDGKLYFRKPKNGKAEVVAIEWGVNLRSYRPKLTASRQVSEVIVQGWDPKTKKEIVGRARRPEGTPKVGETQQGPDVAREVFGGPKMIVVDRPIHSQREADEMAKSICEELAQDYLTAEGVVYGHPKLKAGVMVEIKNLGKKFSGKYYVTATTHTYSPDEGYMTAFVIGGKHPQNILDILGNGHSGGDRSGGSVLNPAGGNIVIGIVTDNVDPEGLGRIRVKYPWLVQDHDSHWARLSTPMAGPGRGFYWIPEINDEVLVGFEHGDMTRPYILGSVWNGKDLPVKPNNKCVQGGNVNQRIIRTRYGHEIILNDTKGGEGICIHTAYGHEFCMDDSAGGQEIYIKTGGGHQIRMRDAGGGPYIAIISTSNQYIVLDDTKKKIEISTPGGRKCVIDDSGGWYTISDCYGNTIKMGATGISISACADLELKATAKVKITAGAGIDIHTGALVDIKGSLIKQNC